MFIFPYLNAWVWDTCVGVCMYGQGSGEVERVRYGTGWFGRRLCRLSVVRAATRASYSWPFTVHRCRLAERQAERRCSPPRACIIGCRPASLGERRVLVDERWLTRRAWKEARGGDMRRIPNTFFPPSCVPQREYVRDRACLTTWATTTGLLYRWWTYLLIKSYTIKLY